MSYWKSALRTHVQGGRGGAPESEHVRTRGDGGLKSGVLVRTYFMDAPDKRFFSGIQNLSLPELPRQQRHGFYIRIIINRRKALR